MTDIQKEISQKLFEIQKLGLKLKKTKKSGFGMYTPLDEVWEEISKHLEQQSLVVYHFVKERNLVTRVVDSTNPGLCIESSFPIEATDPQKVGAAISYGKRYNLGCIFNLITDEDTDGSTTKTTNARASSRDNKPTGVNLERLKAYLLKQSVKMSKDDIEKYLSEKLGREVKFDKTYTDAQAAKDLVALQSNNQE